MMLSVYLSFSLLGLVYEGLIVACIFMKEVAYFVILFAGC